MSATCIMLLVGFWWRPPCPPVTEVDIRAAAAREELFVGEESTRPFVMAEDVLPGRFAVGYTPEARGGVVGSLATLDADILREDADAGFLVVRLDAEQAAALRQVKGVRFVEPDCRVRTSLIPNDPLFSRYQWDKWVMYADKAWDLATSANVKVAIVDNGVDYFHPDLSASFVGGDYGYDFVGGDNDPRPDNTSIPQSFHGTHVAGIVAAGLNNGVGVAGWVRTQLYAVRVLNDSGSGTTTDVASGIRWAADRGARVVNMSLGTSSLPTHLLEACRYAYDRNVLLVAAAGNDGTSNINYPAALSECVCVGAVDTSSALAWFSNYGSEQELVAPGVAVFATGTGGSYVSANGTSMATPQVSGVAALVLGGNGALSASRVRSILTASAIDMGNPGRDATYGYGLVNARRALELAQAIAGHRSPSCRMQVSRGAVHLPDGVRRVVLFDASGRRLRELGECPSRQLSLRPGAYFLLLEGASGAAGRTKVVVLD